MSQQKNTLSLEVKELIKHALSLSGKFPGCWN